MKRQFLALFAALTLLVGGASFVSPDTASAHTYVRYVNCSSNTIGMATHVNGNYIHTFYDRQMTWQERQHYCWWY